MPNFEALLIPVDHVQLFGQSLYIPVDVRYFDFVASNDDTRGQNKRALAFCALLDQWILTIEEICKRLVDIPRLQFWINNVEEWRKAALKKMEFWKRYQVHGDFVHINI